MKTLDHKNNTEGWEEELDRLLNADVGTANIFFPAQVKAFIKKVIKEERKKAMVLTIDFMIEQARKEFLKYLED